MTSRQDTPSPVTLLRILTWATLFNIGLIIGRAIWLIWVR